MLNAIQTFYQYLITLATMSATPSIAKPLQDDVKGRGNISVAGSTDAVAFLASRWKAVEAASQNNAIPPQERPQILKEKAAAANTPTPASNTTAPIPSKPASGASSGSSTPAKGSPWTGGRRH
ncbi:uncharacterized protein FA14DRAFT_169818 [Meira miltonrushii]|uniref:Uncharacterized protein n=1 Tax=Meira miltonrushii TaxID=1280837 RepID=A0A316VMV9_9BASI|nr:uncharacterized protein FA14DRAFT_169818 [Meira miltonrushii]PWN36895.1 hypothetical protein FA14DRAFT_169818 [Meira miltonrushii]